MSTGKKVVLLVIIAAIIGIIAAWLWLQKIITDYDLETTMISLQYMNNLELYPNTASNPIIKL